MRSARYKLFCLVIIVSKYVTCSFPCVHFHSAQAELWLRRVVKGHTVAPLLTINLPTNATSTSVLSCRMACLREFLGVETNIFRQASFIHPDVHFRLRLNSGMESSIVLGELIVNTSACTTIAHLHYSIIKKRQQGDASLGTRDSASVVDLWS